MVRPLRRLGMAGGRLSPFTRAADRPVVSRKIFRRNRIGSARKLSGAAQRRERPRMNPSWARGDRLTTHKRKRRRKKHWPAALFCPIHHCLMRVRCVVGQKQYRYCPVPDCDSSLQTRRTKLTQPRQLCPKKVSGTLQQVDDPLPDRNPKVPDTFFGQQTAAGACERPGVAPFQKDTDAKTQN